MPSCVLRYVFFLIYTKSINIWKNLKEENGTMDREMVLTKISWKDDKDGGHFSNHL